MTDADVQTVLADLTQNRVAHVALSGFLDEGGDCDEVRCRTSANGIITQIVVVVGNLTDGALLSVTHGHEEIRRCH